MGNKLQWNDLRVVLAIEEEGSLSGAGRKLGLSHATVFRRLNDIEDRLGVKLFNRFRSGYVATLAGEEMAELSREMEGRVQEIERRVLGRDLEPSGVVRITTTDTLLFGLLSPVFAEFRVAYPEITLEIVVSNELFNLSRREADVAIRPTARPPENLVGRKVGTITQAVYGSHEVVARQESFSDWSVLDWVGPDERMGYGALQKWMDHQGLGGCCRYRVDTVMGMYSAAEAGIGLAILPCYLGENSETLVRIGDAVPELATDLWSLTHPDLRNMARVRTFLDFLGSRKWLRQVMAPFAL